MQITKSYATNSGHVDIWELNERESVLADHGPLSVSLSIYQEASEAHAAEFTAALARAAELAGVRYRLDQSIDCTLVSIAPDDVQTLLERGAWLAKLRSGDAPGGISGGRR